MTQWSWVLFLQLPKNQKKLPILNELVSARSVKGWRENISQVATRLNENCLAAKSLATEGTTAVLSPVPDEMWLVGFFPYTYCA